MVSTGDQKESQGCSLVVSMGWKLEESNGRIVVMSIWLCPCSLFSLRPNLRGLGGLSHSLPPAYHLFVVYPHMMPFLVDSFAFSLMKGELATFESRLSSSPSDRAV